MKNIKYCMICLLLFVFASVGCGKSSYVRESILADAAETMDEEEPNGNLQEITEDLTEGPNYEEITEEVKKEEKKGTLVVYICGAVVTPGVYELPADARVVQAIEAAGGLRDDADTLSVNQAKRLQDGEQIRILTKEEAEEMQEAAAVEGTNASAESGKVNINLADEDALMTLPGIGQAKASAIIEYREANGGFSSITEIMNISGIKESVFSRIEDKITV